MLAVPRLQLVKTTAKQKRRSVSANADSKLFAKLRHLRKQIADQENLPPYVIFSDVSLSEMSELMPTNDSQFLSITGVGHIKLDKYGEEFLSEIKQYVDTL